MDSTKQMAYAIRNPTGNANASTWPITSSATLKCGKYRGSGGGALRYPISPSSLSNTLLIARVPPFRKITQIARPPSACDNHAPRTTPANPTAST